MTPHRLGFPSHALAARALGQPHPSSTTAPVSTLAAPVLELADPLVARQGGEDEVWMVSYMDIMTLLLTLLVLLFVYTQAVAPKVPVADHGHAQQAEAGREMAAVALSARMAMVEDEPTLVVPPQWLGALVEPPIPGLAARFVGALAEGAMAEAADAQMPVETAVAHAAPTQAVDTGEGTAAEMAGSQVPVETAIAHAAPAPAVVLAVSALAAPPGTSRGPAEPTPEARPAAAPGQGARDDLFAVIEAGGLGRRVEVTRRQDVINLEIGDEILFDRGSAQLKSGGEALLAELARLLRQQTVTISVEGHTDDVPIHNARFASNWELSTARATAVTRQLVAHALDPTRVRAVGHADTRPRADNATAEGRARNRRVTVVLHVPASAKADPMATSP